MTKEAAYEMLFRVLRSLKLSADEHEAVQTALKVLATPPAPVENPQVPSA